MPRQLNWQPTLSVNSDLERKFDSIDFTRNPRSFIINGGCGSGKTFTALNISNEAFSLKHALEKRFGKKINMAFLCSREAAKTQNVVNYVSTTESLIPITDEETIEPYLDKNNILCITYHSFMLYVEKKQIDEKTFDVIVCDEAHSLFTDTYAYQMGAFLKWHLKYNRIIIWMTATDEYFQECYSIFMELKGFPRPRFQRLYEGGEQDDFMGRYNTKNVVYSKSSYAKLIIEPIAELVDKDHRALVFLNSAKECYKYYKIYKEKAGFYISPYSTSINEDGENLLELFNENEKQRRAEGKIPLRKALLENENFPADIDILFTTDALRESVNIQKESNVKYIITDDNSSVGVIQKRGRVRSDIDTFFIIPRRKGVEQGLDKQLNNFARLMNCSQQELCQAFGVQEEGRDKYYINRNTAYVLKMGNSRENKAEYEINFAAKIGLEKQKKEFLELNSSRTARYECAGFSPISPEERFQCLSTNPIEVWEEETTREFYESVMTDAKIKNFLNVPIVGEVKERLLETMKEVYVSCHGDKKFDLKTIFARLRKYGYEVEQININKKHLANGTPKEFYRAKAMIIKDKKSS